MCVTFIPIALPPFNFHGLGGGEEKRGLPFLLSAAALLVCIPADRKVSLRNVFFV